MDSYGRIGIGLVFYAFVTKLKDFIVDIGSEGFAACRTSSALVHAMIN